MNKIIFPREENSFYGNTSSKSLLVFAKVCSVVLEQTH